MNNSHLIRGSNKLAIIFFSILFCFSESGFAQVNRIVFELSDQSVIPGQAIIITASVYGADGKKITDSLDSLSWELVDNFHENFVKIQKKDGGKAVVYGLTDDPTSPDAKNTRPSSVPILARYKEDKLDIKSVVSVGLQPDIPREVDLQWMVMPKSSCGDNFGTRIKKKYYCIVLVIGNQSGFDLQVASVGFTVPELALPDGADKKPVIPNTPYQLVRGTLEKEQKVGLRAVASSSIKALGNLATGFVPFFKVPTHQASFSNAINIFSNPLAEGFNLVYPDLTINQAFKLDDFSFRNDLSTRTIIPSNTQVVTVVFFPKTFLFSENKKKTKGFNKEDIDDPQMVMQKLGEVVLIGRQVQFSNRIRLNSTASPPPSENGSGEN